MNSIQINHVTKNFGSTCAVNNVSLQFEENKIYGLLGRNGAGKSTLLNIISNRIYPDEGVVLVDEEKNIDNDNALSKIYLMSEKTLYPDKMKVEKAFSWSKHFYPNFDYDYAMDLAKQFQLNTKKTVMSLSTGYCSIFKLIIALSVNVPYIILDEPVLGLDANHRDLFYRIILEKYSKSPCTIIISTHLIEEVSHLIEHVIMIDRGVILRDTNIYDLLASGYSITGKASQVDDFIKGKELLGMDQIGGLKTAYIHGNRHDIIPAGLEVSNMDLQKLFIKLTNS